MRPFALALLSALTIAPALDAQNGYPRRFRFEFGGSAGSFRHETESSTFDGDTDGGLLRVRFEGLSRSGPGGGVRFEGWGSDDDLFVNEGFAAQEASVRDFYGHFTFRAGRGKFRMPIRVGLMLNNYELETTAGGVSTLELNTIGPRFEAAPEFIFNRGSVVEVSGYGEFGLGFGYSNVEVSTSSSDFDSASVLWGIELGARVRFKFFELGLAFVNRGLVMEESDTVGTTFINSFGAGYSGVLFTGAFVF